MQRGKHLPCALTIAGSDSGGGAGIQADLKTFAALGVHGTSAITCLTAQNPMEVIGIQPCPSGMVGRQIRAVFNELPPAAVKTGMLYSAAIIREVSALLRQRTVALVVDPVMVSTSGASLLKTDAVRALTHELLPLASVITPNVDEAQILSRRSIRSVEDLRSAARDLHQRFGCASLVKGGHLRGLSRAIDIFYDGEEELMLEAAFAKGVSTHGTGCTYSAAVAAYLARGKRLADSVVSAKNYITNAIFGSQSAGKHSILNWFAEAK